MTQYSSEQINKYATKLKDPNDPYAALNQVAYIQLVLIHKIHPIRAYEYVKQHPYEKKETHQPRDGSFGNIFDDITGGISSAFSDLIGGGSIPGIGGGSIIDFSFLEDFLYAGETVLETVPKLTQTTAELLSEEIPAILDAGKAFIEELPEVISTVSEETISLIKIIVKLLEASLKMLQRFVDGFIFLTSQEIIWYVSLILLALFLWKYR